MDAEAHELMGAREAEHWWFRGRRAVIGRLLDRLPLPPDAAILEAGCGTGGNFGLLSRYGRVAGFDPSPVAIGIAAERHPHVEVRAGRLPDELPFAAGTFDLVAAFDVLEHVADDRSALAALLGLVRPGGHLVLTVPAHPVLFGSHDRRLQHHRRYRPRAWDSLLAGAGAEVLHATAFNTLLAPFALIPRLLERLTGVELGDQERIPPRPANAALTRIFALEAPVAARCGLPLGLSLAASLRRPAIDRGAAA